MKKRIQKWNAAVIIILALLIAALFLLIMDLTKFLVRSVVTMPGYGVTLVSELVDVAYVMVVLVVLGYHKILQEKGEGFLRGFYIGGFMTAYCIYEVFGQFYLQRMAKAEAQPFFYILMFIAAVFLIGVNEEIVFRGIILNLFLDKFGNSKKGILTSTILSGVIFGAVHLTNIFSGVSVGSATIQAVEAALLGILFAQIYLRSGNIWITVIFHALTDFASMLPSGIYGAGNAVDTINKLSAINFIAIPVFLIPVLVLFRKNKLEELVQKRNGVAVMPSEAECEHTAIVSLILGIISITMSCMGYGLAFGVVGILGAYIALKDGGKKSGMIIAGFVTSAVGIAISVIAVAFMLCLMPEMAGTDILRRSL